MTVFVTFAKPGALGSVHAPGVGAARVRESLTIPATTAGAFADGEMAIVVNGEASSVAVATGSTPDAAAAAATVGTTAGVVIPAGGWLPIVGKVGDMINVKAIS
jgi:hypothetical protein